MPKELSKVAQKRALFVREYLIDRNGTRAAKAAGFAEKSAHVAASRLLKDDKVLAEIERQTEKRLARLEITADKVLQEVAKLAFFDPRKLFNEDGTPKHVTDLDEVTAAAVAGLDVEELYEGRGAEREHVGVVHRIKVADKKAALELLGRNLKLWTDKVEHSNTFDGWTDKELEDYAKTGSLPARVNGAAHPKGAQ